MEPARQAGEYGQPAENAPGASYQQGQDTRPSAYPQAAPTPGPDYTAAGERTSGSFNSYVQQPPSRHYAGHQHTPPANMGSNNPSIASQTASPSAYPSAPQGQHPYGAYEGMPHPHHQQYAPMYSRWHEPHYPLYGSAAPTSVLTSPTTMRAPPNGGHPMQQVYSFVPIPGAQQHKRPRRRYEEIERMYKCGWMGCEKAYGTLNHLNAHVTMQAHGTKRTPEEFKEIRKEWKAKKKEEEANRKAAEEAAQRNGDAHHAPSSDGAAVYGTVRPAVAGMAAPPASHPQLPPIGYQPANNNANVPSQYGTQSPGNMDPSQNSGYPQSPYAQNPYNQQGPH